MSMHVQNEPVQQQAFVEINIVSTQRVAIRIQNQYARQIEVVSVHTCIGSTGERLVSNEALF